MRECLATAQNDVVFAIDDDDGRTPRRHEGRPVGTTVKDAHATHDVFDLLLEREPARRRDDARVRPRRQHVRPSPRPGSGESVLLQHADDVVPERRVGAVTCLRADEYEQPNPVRRQPRDLYRGRSADGVTHQHERF